MFFGVKRDILESIAAEERKTGRRGGEEERVRESAGRRGEGGNTSKGNTVD